MKKFQSMYLALSLLLASAVPSFATGTLTVPAIDLTDFYAAAAVLMTALAAMWIAHKVIGFFKGK